MGERVTKVVDRKEAAEAMKSKKPGEIIIVDLQKEHLKIDIEEYIQEETK